jgi:hypothetical protein
MATYNIFQHSSDSCLFFQLSVRGTRMYTYGYGLGPKTPRRRRKTHVALSFISIFFTVVPFPELKKDERARDLKAMGHATFFLSSIDDSALIDQVHRECAPDAGGTKSRVQSQATGSGPVSRSRVQSRR